MISKGKTSVVLIVSICCAILMSGCSSDPCSNVKCPDKCRGVELWSQFCEKGECFYYKQVSDCSSNCGCKPQTSTTSQTTQSTTTSQNEKIVTYSHEMTEIMNNLSESAQYCMGLLTRKPLGPKYWTQEEILTFAMYTVVIERAYDDAKKVEVPSGFEAIQLEILEGLRKYSLAMPLLRQGLDEMNADKLNMANTYIEQGSVNLNRGTTMIYEKMDSLN